MFKRLVLCLSLSLCGLPLAAQVQTGLYPNGSFDNLGFDTIDRGSLNVHFTIPVVSKTGRGLGFSYQLVYDGVVWSPTNAQGVATWVPVPGFGLHGQLNEGYVGYISYYPRPWKCYPPGGGSFSWTYINQNYVYHDVFGVSHPFDYTVNYCTDVTSGTGKSTDGSGFSFNGTFVSGPDGKQITAPFNNQSASGTIADANGNFISNQGNGKFTDTLGTTALTITGSGTAASPRVFTYNTPTGTAFVKVTYKTYTVQTTFSCASTPFNVSEDMVDTIVLGDSSFYQFSYEPTPGVPAGPVTARLAKITLPQGGTITYAYGPSNGIVCADGTPQIMTRTDSANHTRTYTRSNITAATSHTDVTDGLGNVSNFDFVMSGTTEGFYETQRTVNQTSPSGVLLTRQTCYNKAVPPACKTAALTLPVSQIDTYETMNGQERGSTWAYNTFGLLTTKTDYDFSTNTTAHGNILRQESWVYPPTGIANLVKSDTVTDGTNNIGSTSYLYDEGSAAATSVPQHSSTSGQRGNLTTIQQYAGSATAALTTTTTYEDTGNALSVSDPTGQTILAYKPNNHAFLVNSTPPTPSSQISLPSSATYDDNSGVQLGSTDPNMQTTTFQSYDKMLRPTLITYPDGGNLTAAYTPNQVRVYRTMDTSGAQTSTQATVDGYGRPNAVAVQNASGGYYWNNYCYDGNGNLQYSAYPFTSGTLVCSGTGGDTYTYDALGRVTKLARGDGSYLTYTYNGRDTQTTDENGVSRVIEVDGLGRPTAVCEVSANPQKNVSPSSCQLANNSASGFVTKYVYSTDTAAGNALKTTVTQGTQTRSFETDWLGRTTSVTEPESGTTTYSYAYSSGTGLGLTVTRVRPHPNQTGSLQTTTISQYDSLGRLVSVTYSDGTPAKQFAYDQPQGWTNASPQTNVKGRLSLQSRVTGAGAAGSIYGYDAMGRVTTQTSCLPSGCGNGTYNKGVAYTYNFAGMLTSEGDGAGNTYSYTRSIAGEITGMTDSFSDATDPAHIIVPNSVQNGPFGPTIYNLGNGLTAVNAYDTLGRNSGGWVCSGSSKSTCTGGTQLYGYLAQTTGTQVNNSCDTVLNVCDSFGYDEFNRLTARNVTQGTVQNFAYTYDRFGNRWSQSAPQGGPSLSISFNQANNLINTAGYSYDAAGNLSNDTAHTYGYDADGNLITVDANGETAKYYYDSLNQRVQIAPTRGTYEFVWDIFGRRVSSWEAANHSFVESNAYTDWGPIAMRAGGSTTFEHQNWLGTERLRTSYNGSKLTSLSSLPWGDGLTPSGDNGDQHDFAGLDRDLEDNTEHAQYRQYSTNLGRWQSPDLYLGSYDFTNPQSLNRYSYALNNPLSFTDPSGLDPTCTTDPQTGTVTCTSDYPSCTTDPAASGCQSGNWCGGASWGTQGCISWPCWMIPGCQQTSQPPSSNPPSTGSSGGSAPNNLVPSNPCQFQGNAMSPGQYAAAGAGAAALGPVPFLAISGAGFPRGSYLDAQPKASGNVFQRAAYGNYSFGVYMASAGVPYAVTMQAANAFAMFSHYTAKNGPMDSTYTNLPNANVQNITNGFNAARNGTTCHR